MRKTFKITTLLAATLLLLAPTAQAADLILKQNLQCNKNLTVKGALKIEDAGDDHNITIVPGNEAANRNLSIPVMGANGEIVLTVADQTIAGTKTFSTAPAVPAGSFARTKLATDSAADYVLDVQSDVRNDDGTILTASAAAGKFGITNGGHGVAGLKLSGEAAQNNTKTDYASAMVVLPPEYVAGSAITVKFTAKYSGSGTAGGTKTVDCEAYKLAKAGTVGSDICATAAQNFTSSSVEYSFTVTPTGLVAGDKLQLFFTMALQETVNSSTVTGEISDIRVSMDIKG